MNAVYLNAQSLIPLNTANYRSPDIPFHNPAAISFFENYHIMVSTLFLHTGLVDESMQYSLLNFAYPFDNKSALGARVQYFTSNIFQQGDFSLMYGQRLFNDVITLGLNVNLLHYGYDKDNFFLFDYNDPLVEGATSQNAFSFGLSFLARPTSSLLIGVSADHLNSPDISISEEDYKKDKVINVGLAYLNWFVVPQFDIRLEGEEIITQGLLGKKLFNNNFNVKIGYSSYQKEGSSFFAELDFFLGDLGIMYSFRNQLGELSDVAGASHQIGLFYTKGESVSIPEIILSNIDYDSHLPELVLNGRAVNESGLDYIKIENNDAVQEIIKCDNNIISENILKTVFLEPGENEIIVSAFAGDVVQRERILVEFNPIPPVIEIKSPQNTQVDDDKYEFLVNFTDLVGLETIEIVFNDQRINSFTDINKKSETVRLPVILKSGENKFRVVASNQWKSEELSAFITYKSAELPPVLTIDSPQMPESASSSVIINLELENKKYIEEIIIKVNGEQKEVIKLKPNTRGVKTIESSIPVSYESFATGSASKTVELSSAESIIEAIAYDATGLPRTSSKILKILYNPYQESLKYNNKTAIIIGIDNYKSEKISKLDLAVSDAQNIKGVLNDFYQFDEIYTLYNDKATFTEISREVYSQLKKAGPQDLVVLYFAGHGITIEDQIGGESGYLLPYDSDLETDLNTISMTNLNQKAIQSRAKDVLFIIDACYSGLGLISVPPLSQYPSENIDYEKLKNENSKISRNIITAGGKKQEAVDGLFTRFLKTGLTGAADYNHDNYITSNELGYYLKSNVAKEAKKYNMEQTPQFGSIISDQGEVVFSKDN
jgi:hypothetical protein